MTKDRWRSAFRRAACSIPPRRPRQTDGARSQRRQKALTMTPMRTKLPFALGGRICALLTLKMKNKIPRAKRPAFPSTSVREILR